ncbi:family 43 glycosylhydrolase [Flavobacterium sp.]|uniref:family 43 glycosylhydrolase n=1 Tax=Flavobacterium sp. TaxID=239 RepID=UPI00326627B0
MKKQTNFLIIQLVFVFSSFLAIAQNPIIRNQYSADPSARVFGDRIYVYPSHDILATEGKGRKDWFCMEDYHVFSSENLTDWTDHGMIVQQNKVPWVKPDSYSMWAPDCIERNGKYYFYFPSVPKDTTSIGRGFTIGVAVAEKPTGPFVPEVNPIKGVKGIDPNVFMDKDGQAYLYWSAGNIFAAKLKSNMLELDSEVKTLGDLPTKGLKEGPYMFERNGIYYLTYPHVENKIERLEYAMSDNPLGPFKVTGVIMDESPTGCWTNHHSILEFKKQWYLFYHHNDYSPAFDKARSVRADALSFNPDGTIIKVIPTLRGIGVSNAAKEIQIDRYSNISDKGTSIAFLDELDHFKGWKTILNNSGAWVQYNAVDFGKKSLKWVIVRAMSANGGTLQIRTKGFEGPLIAEVKIPAGTNWSDIKIPVKKFEGGIQNLVVVLNENNKNVEVDWISFK